MNTVHIAILYSFVDINPNCSDILSPFYLFCCVLASTTERRYKVQEEESAEHISKVMPKLIVTTIPITLWL
jgi:hypothetical protein